MRGRGRVRWAAKWAGLLLCVLIAGLWTTSLLWTLSRANNRWNNEVALRQGGILLAFGTSFRKDLWDTPEVRWVVGYRSRAEPIRWLPTGYPDMVRDVVFVPLWLPLVVALAPVGWLYYRNRRVRLGHCSACGYDLAGLTPGAACPECGSAKRMTGAV